MFEEVLGTGSDNITKKFFLYSKFWLSLDLALSNLLLCKLML
jgi:hypothetical protein